jgi:hypothetical protein
VQLFACIFHVIILHSVAFGLLGPKVLRVTEVELFRF